LKKNYKKIEKKFSEIFFKKNFEKKNLKKISKKRVLRIKIFSEQSSTHFNLFQPTSAYFNVLHPFTTETNRFIS